MSYRLAVFLFHDFPECFDLPPFRILGTRRRQRLVDAREDYAFVFREPMTCAHTAERRAMSQLRHFLLDGKCASMNMSSQTGSGTEGYLRQVMVEEIQLGLAADAGHQSKSRDGDWSYILRGQRGDCCKSRIASLGIHLYYLLL
jgi:hypothetical protein